MRTLLDDNIVIEKHSFGAEKPRDLESEWTGEVKM